MRQQQNISMQTTPLSAPHHLRSIMVPLYSRHTVANRTYDSSVTVVTKCLVGRTYIVFLCRKVRRTSESGTLYRGTLNQNVASKIQVNSVVLLLRCFHFFQEITRIVHKNQTLQKKYFAMQNALPLSLIFRLNYDSLWTTSAITLRM